MRALEFTCRSDGENYISYTSADGEVISNQAQGLPPKSIILHFSFALFDRPLSCDEVKNYLSVFNMSFDKLPTNTKPFQNGPACFVQYGIPKFLEIHLQGDLGLTVDDIRNYEALFLKHLPYFSVTEF